VSRLGAGTVALARRYRIWLWEDGAARGLLRVVGGVAALGFTGGVCLAAPVLIVPAVGGLVLAAWANGRAPDGEEEGETEPEDYSPEEFLGHLHELMAATDRLHLAQIAEQLYDDETATGQVRDLCAAAEVTITRGVRVRGRKVSTGIYRRDLPPLPAGTERGPVAVVVPGQGEQQQQQHPDSNGFVTIPDPAGNPVRHEIRWITDHTRQTA
jgi:hypothetical protein